MEHTVITKRHHVLMYDDVFEGMYLNIHIIIAKHHVFVIDSGLGSLMADDINQVIETYGKHKPIILINSHAHWDHVWGNGFIDSEWIVSSTHCARTLQKDFIKDLEANKQYVRGDVRVVLPTLTFDSKLWFNEDGIELGVAPGHTDNDIYVYDAIDKVLNVGDNIGDTDDECLPYLEQSIDIYRESVKHYQTFEVEHVVSGHNKILDAAIFDRILNTIK